MNIRLLPALLAVALTGALVACNGGGDDEDPTAIPETSPSAVATSASTVAPGLTSSGEIREIDLAAQADVLSLEAESDTTFVQEDVLYADLTGDGIEEAVVPLQQGGTQGYAAFLVLTPDGEKTATLLQEQPAGGRGFALGVQGDTLVMVEPVPGPEDPECCPSMLRRTTYAWNGAALAVDDVQTVPNPDGGVKTPSVSP